MKYPKSIKRRKYGTPKIRILPRVETKTFVFTFSPNVRKNIFAKFSSFAKIEKFMFVSALMPPIVTEPC